MKRCITTVLTVLLAFSLMTAAGCSGEQTSVSYKDGTYTGRSADHQEDEEGNGSGYGETEIVIKDNKITSCKFAAYELDGTLKDDSYGADLTKENRLKAQKAVQASAKYGSMLVSGGSLDSVDAISGATISYEEFKEAVNDALKKAENN